MKNLRLTFAIWFAAAFSLPTFAQREDKLINQDWSFRFSHHVNANAAHRVDFASYLECTRRLGGEARLQTGNRQLY